MRYCLKQRLFSWFDSYDIYDESGNLVFTVEGKLAWGHRLHILNMLGEHIATVKQTVLTLMPQFELYEGERYIGCVRKKFSVFTPKFHVDCKGWSVSGDFFGWEYSIIDLYGRTAANISKQLFNFTDTYVIDTADDNDALYAFMVALAIDAEKCSDNK